MRGRVAWRRESEIEKRFYLFICIRVSPDVLDRGEAGGFRYVACWGIIEVGARESLVCDGMLAVGISTLRLAFM